VEKPHYHARGSGRDDLCITTSILRIIRWATTFDPASVLEPQSADTSSQVLLLF